MPTYGGGQVRQERRQVLAGQHLGAGWKDAVEEVLMPAATREAQVRVRDASSAGDGDIVVEVPMTVFVRFAREGEHLAGDAGVSCVCTITDGGAICTCIGQCNFDACCDVDAGSPPIA